MKKILLICSAGMSTSLLVQKMQESAKQQNIQVEITAMGEGEAKQNLDKCDIILLGPQVRYLLSKMKKLIEGKDIKIDVIESINYGTMNGAKVIEQALSL